MTQTAWDQGFVFRLRDHIAPRIAACPPVGRSEFGWESRRSDEKQTRVAVSSSGQVWKVHMRVVLTRPLRTVAVQGSFAYDWMEAVPVVDMPVDEKAEV